MLKKTLEINGNSAPEDGLTRHALWSGILVNLGMRIGIHVFVAVQVGPDHECDSLCGSMMQNKQSKTGVCLRWLLRRQFSRFIPGCLALYMNRY